MKKKLLFLTFLSFFISFNVVNASEEDVITDPILKEALLNLEYPEQPWLPNIDTNKNGKISEEEAGAFCGSCGDESRLDLVGYGFESIEGMQYFDSIKQFYFMSNNVTDITPLLGMDSLEATAWDYNRVGFSSSYTLYNYAKDKDVIFQRTIDLDSVDTYKQLILNGVHISTGYQQIEHDASKITINTPKHRVLFVIVNEIDADFETTDGSMAHVEYKMDDLDRKIIHEQAKLYEKWAEVQSGYQLDIIIDFYETTEKITNENNDLFEPGLTSEYALDYATFPYMIHEVKDKVAEYDTSFAIIYMSDTGLFTDQNDNVLTFSAGTAGIDPITKRGQVYISWSSFLNVFFVADSIKNEDDLREIKLQYIEELKKGYNTTEIDTYVHEFIHTLEMFEPYKATWEYHDALRSSCTQGDDPLYNEYSEGMYANSLYLQGIPNPNNSSQVGIVSDSYLNSPSKYYSEDIDNPGKAILSSSINQNNRIVLSWDETTNTDYYRIYRSRNENHSYEYLGKLEDNSYTDLTAKKGYTYYYRVESVNVDGNSVEFATSDAISMEIPVPKYDIIVDEDYVGYIFVNTEVSIAGEEISITCNPNEGYECVNIKAVNADTNEEVNVSNNKFIMPEFNVKLSATIRKKVTKPDNFRVEIGRYNNSVTLDFNLDTCTVNNNCPQTFQIYSSLDDDKYTLLGTVTLEELINNDKVFMHNNLNYGSTYYYKIRGYNDNYGEKLYSDYADMSQNSVYIYLNGVSELNDLGSDYNYALIGWEKNLDATSYVVYRSTNGNSFVKIATLGSNTSSYKDTSVVVGNEYSYKIKAAIKVGTKTYYSNYSDPVYFDIKVSSTNLDGYSDYYTYAKIKWSKVNGATGYRVFRSETEDGSYKSLGYTSNTYYNDTTAEEGKEYYYKVRPYRTVSGTKKYGDTSNAAIASRMNDSITFSTSKYSYNTNKITINKDVNATKYYIYRATSSKGTYSKIATLYAEDFDETLEYLDKGLTFNKTYYYKVKMVYKNTSEASSYKSRKVSLTGASEATGTYDYYTYARINFTKVSGASGYAIYRSETEDGKYEQIGKTTNLYYLDKTAKEDTAYYYKVRAYRMSGSTYCYSSDYSNVTIASRMNDSITFSASKYSYNTNKITINKDDNATKYYLYRATSSKGTYTKIATLYEEDFAGDIEYLDKGLTFNKTYYYKVKMVYKNTSAYSGYKSRKTALTGSTTAIGTNDYYTYARVNFAKLSAASGYSVYRSDSIDGKYTLLGSTTNLYYLDKTALEGVTYYYKVRAYKLSNGTKIYSSDYSNIVEATRLVDDITFVLSSEEAKSNKITIFKDLNATKYYVYRATSKTGTYSKIATLNAEDFDSEVTYTDTKLTSKKTYYYKIKMVYKNTSSYSKYKYVKTK